VKLVPGVLADTYKNPGVPELAWFVKNILLFAVILELETTLDPEDNVVIPCFALDPSLTRNPLPRLLAAMLPVTSNG
jgi:hypothetical protein